jgi:FMN hydrolase / 5-amino-6-(5-phospho-D-ribitylamino)uracil phosphatase
MPAPSSTLAVTFDFGQTLCDLDSAMLARRLGERGVAARAEQLEAGVTAAWRAYDAAIAAGLGGHPWKTFMARLLESAGVAGPARDAAVDWLWTEQPRRNLWRRPIAGMIELVRELRGAGVPVGVVSNSEGRLEELVAELGWASDFAVIADSGRLGMEKPETPIFRWTAERLGAPLEQIVHVGDSWGADVDGARRAGMRAIWFRARTLSGPSAQPLPPEIRRAEEAAEVRAALVSWGASLGA